MPIGNRMSLFELTERFPDEDAAREWWENLQWPNGRYCPHCGSLDTREVASRRPQPYRCRDCKSYFSVRTGTVLQSSNVSLRKWAFAVYLYASSNKGISSMQLHRLLHVTQKTAWFMLHRLREAWDDGQMGEFLGLRSKWMRLGLAASLRTCTATSAKRLVRLLDTRRHWWWALVIERLPWFGRGSWRIATDRLFMDS